MFDTEVDVAERLRVEVTGHARENWARIRNARVRPTTHEAEMLVLRRTRGNRGRDLATK